MVSVPFQTPPDRELRSSCDRCSPKRGHRRVSLASQVLFVGHALPWFCSSVIPPPPLDKYVAATPRLSRWACHNNQRCPGCAHPAPWYLEVGRTVGFLVRASFNIRQARGHRMQRADTDAGLSGIPSRCLITSLGPPSPERTPSLLRCGWRLWRSSGPRAHG